MYPKINIMGDSMKSKFLLSVIIPTKNRQKYVLGAVEQILNINDNRIQIIIQDNSDDDTLLESLQNYKAVNERLKYNYTPGIISFVDNFSIAVGLADGEYVCIIGDDDGILPYIIEVVEWASKNNIKAIKPELNAVYFWPNSEATKNKKDNGYLNISKITARSKVCNTYNGVIKLLKQGGQNYLSLNLVKLYHGIIKKECLNNIKEVTGKYFGGLSPDIYISVALSLIIKSVVVIDVPLTISGICNKSGSADSATGRHTGNLEDAPHFHGHNNYKWSDLVPQFYSVETIWADSTLAAINDMKYVEVLDNFNVSALATKCIRKYPIYKKLIIIHYKKWLKNTGKSKIRLDILNLKYFCIFNLKKIVRRINRKPGDVVHVYQINNINEACKVIQNRFDDLHINNKTIIQSLEKLNLNEEINA
jgi:Glycosyltransferases involved in cell wall biogenesis